LAAVLGERVEYLLPILLLSERLSVHLGRQAIFTTDAGFVSVDVADGGGKERVVRGAAGQVVSGASGLAVLGMAVALAVGLLVTTE
jgi:hypothetical protein